MKRKVFAVLIVFALALSFASAANHSFSAQISPYSHQLVGMNNHDQFKSQYGWGAKLGYRYQFKGFDGALGADISFSDYKFKEVSKPYLVISILAKAGINVSITKALSFDFDFGGGIDIRSLNSVTKIYPAFGIYTGLSYAVSPVVDVTAGADFRVTRQKNTYADYSSFDTSILCNLGVKVNL